MSDLTQHSTARTQKQWRNYRVILNSAEFADRHGVTIISRRREGTSS